MASVKRAAKFEAAVTFLESSPLRRLRNTVVGRAAVFDLFLARQAGSG